jgi:hypothetical protein
MESPDESSNFMLDPSSFETYRPDSPFSIKHALNRPPKSALYFPHPAATQFVSPALGKKAELDGDCVNVNNLGLSHEQRMSPIQYHRTRPNTC